MHSWVVVRPEEVPYEDPHVNQISDREEFDEHNSSLDVPETPTPSPLPKSPEPTECANDAPTLPSQRRTWAQMVSTQGSHTLTTTKQHPVVKTSDDASKQVQSGLDKYVSSMTHE